MRLVHHHLVLLAPLRHFLLLRRTSAVVQGLSEGQCDRLLLVTPLSTQSSLSPPHRGSSCAINKHGHVNSWCSKEDGSPAQTTRETLNSERLVVVLVCGETFFRKKKKHGKKTKQEKKREKTRKAKKDKNVFEKPKTPCFGRKVSTRGREGSAQARTSCNAGRLRRPTPPSWREGSPSPIPVYSVTKTKKRPKLRAHAPSSPAVEKSAKSRAALNSSRESPASSSQQLRPWNSCSLRDTSLLGLRAHAHQRGIPTTPLHKYTG